MANKRAGRRVADAAEDWHAVARAINARMTQRQITQQGLATVSGVSVATLRLLQNGTTGRRAQNTTLVAVARALGWPDDHLIRVLLGALPTAPVAPSAVGVPVDEQILAALLRIEERIGELADRFDNAASRG